MTDSAINRLTRRIIACAIEVHRTLGAGLLESVYRQCLIIELIAAHLKVASEQPVKLVYKGTPVKSQLRLDLIVENSIVVELKAVEAIHPVHIAQMITYLKLTGCPAGLILNFNVCTLKTGIRRVDHPDRYAKRPKHFSFS